MLEHLKEYLAQYRNVLFTTLLVVLIDHFFLKGALRAKVTEKLSGLLDKE